MDLALYLKAKANGFSDKRIAQIINKKELFLENFKTKNNLHSCFKNIDTCSGEFKSFTPYMYSTWNNIESSTLFEDRLSKSKKKVIIIGGGPIELVKV